MSEFKKYDSNHRYEINGVRLAKEPKVVDTDGGKMVTLTFVATSRKDKHSDMWWEAVVNDRQADLAACLQKNDTLHQIAGFPVLRKFGENNEKFALGLERAEIVVPIDLFVVCKDERGFVPGAAKKEKGEEAPSKKPAKKAAAPAKKPATRKEVVELDDGDDEDSDDGED